MLKVVADDEYFNVAGLSVLASGASAPTEPTTPTTGGPTNLAFVAPKTGTTLSGQSIACELTGTGIARVDFSLDGSALNTEGSAPWNCLLDTTKFADGAHQLKARAYDADGKYADAQVDVTIQNATSSGGSSGGGSSGPSSLLFWTGFEGTTVPGTPLDCYKNGCYQEITGKDSWTGFTWPPVVKSSKARYQMLSNSGSMPSPSTIGEYMWNQVQTVTGPKGNSTKAMYSHIAKSGCCGTGEQGSGSTQLPYLIYPDSDVPELYISKWIKLQPDLSEKMGSGNWRAIYETKTSDTDHRLIVYVNTDASGKPYWMVRTDSWTPKHVDYWRVYNYDVPVPVGQWFKFEAYFKRSAGSDGRVWVAVNGKVITDKYGPTMGPNKSPINRIFMTQVYSGSAYPIYQWVDNVQVWSTFPTAKSTDAWYDPPYAPK